MGRPPRHRIVFDGQRVLEDAADRGWSQTDLARHAEVSDAAISRFISGEYQTPGIAKNIASALGYSIRRYRVAREKVPA